MHTYKQRAGKEEFVIYFVNTNERRQVGLEFETLKDAIAMVSYLNGGNKPSL